MDVTPRELRDIDIRERFGGYNRDDVDDLLERAAARIEGLEVLVRDVSARAEVGDADAGKTRETEDMLHRTLLLAQRAADEAVAEAQSKARQILDDAELKARTTISEAETTARRQAENERRRLETEVVELGAKRDALVADVDALERFESDYRARLRRAVGADLEMLSSKGSVAPAPRPTIHDVEIPGAASAPMTAEVFVSPPPPAPTPSVVIPATPAPVPPPAFGVAASEPPLPPVAASPFSVAAPAPAPTPAPTAAPEAPAFTPSAPSAPTSSQPPWEEAPSVRQPLFDAEPEPEPEQLDDDAFFASLREAVTDETPLGPRDTAAGADLFDQDDRGSGGLFRRRGR